MSPPNPHPSYVNPTIAEALCELHFTLPGGGEFQQQWYGDFFTQARAEYPIMEPQEVTEFIAGFGPDGMTQSKQQRLRMIYRHGGRNDLIQLSENVLTVNVLPRYAGWAAFKNRIRIAWDLFQRTASPIGLSRIGLRYINRIPKRTPTEPVSTWLRSAEFFPFKILESESGYHSRLQLPLGPNRRMVVIVAELEEESGKRAIMLDIDLIRAAQIGAAWNEIESCLEELHDQAWEVFEKSKSPALDALLREAAHA
jgi:uncharacterized protein (TIGR04255 family)